MHQVRVQPHGVEGIALSRMWKRFSVGGSAVRFRSEGTKESSSCASASRLNCFGFNPRYIGSTFGRLHDVRRHLCVSFHDLPNCRQWVWYHLGHCWCIVAAIPLLVRGGPNTDSNKRRSGRFKNTLNDSRGMVTLWFKIGASVAIRWDIEASWYFVASQRDALKIAQQFIAGYKCRCATRVP